MAIFGMLLAPTHGFADDREVSIVLAGDSTVADWAKEKPARGWGQVLAPLLSDNVRVINLAVCGASTKTFPATGNWKRAVEHKPEFVFIQFGHNDSHAPSLPEATGAEGEFTTNLERYISEARAAGIVPVLITPMHRRMFGPEGRLTEELAPYAAAVRNVAKTNQVPLIDLYASSGELLTRLGEAGSASLTVSDKDRTHFTEVGAGVMAGLVVEGMRNASPDVAKLVRANPSTP
ncbi:MAG: rhamnogalacturonan acetylesterase [Terrimicrobiaceae bacterium]